MNTTAQAIATALTTARAAAPASVTATNVPAPHNVESTKGKERMSFHIKLFAVAFDSAELVCKAVETQRERMRDVLRQHYGDVCPTFAQFKADRLDLKARALERGLVDDQWVRKPYNAAVIDLYGALPESDSAAAVAKRAQRDGAVKAVPAPSAKAGAVKGQTTDRDPSASETIEQFIAKHGAGNVLASLAKILATQRESALDAKTLQAVASKYK